MSDGAITVIGGGLAGCEAAWQVAEAGARARLYEMRPGRSTEAHRTDRLAELVCSNSFRNDSLETAVGLLKEEMRRLGSVVIRVADSVAIPAGSALAVDREGFAAAMTKTIEGHPGIEVVREEAERIGEGVVIVATGPLTSPQLSADLQQRLGQEHLYFYDAIAPIVTAESVDRSIAFAASRYGKGGDDYLNCPLARDEYYAFVDAVQAAEKVPSRDFERCVYFEGCMPIEEMARRGRDTLAFGPMRPVGLVDPRTGARPFAVVQLRRDDAEGRLYNLVGFQTKMKHPAQRRVFHMVPGLQHAEFVRLGSLHRNTFMNSPAVLRPTLQMRGDAGKFIAGQLVGVEGYVESAATGLVAGRNAVRAARGLPPLSVPGTTSLGSLLRYVTDRSRREFQPMNANYGLFPPLRGRERGRDRRRKHAERALRALAEWMAEQDVAGR